MFKFKAHYLPLISLFGWVAMFGIKPFDIFWGNCVALIYHLALVPVVRRLPGPIEIRMSGYLWTFFDALIDVISINHIGEDNVWALRMGVHLFAAIWMVGTSIQLKGAPRYIGVPMGSLLLIHAIFGADLAETEMVLGAFIIPMMIAWLISLSIYLRRNPEPIASEPVPAG